MPDGRNPASGSVNIETPRTATLASFNGLPGSGEWVFTFADLSPGGTATMQSWSLELSGTAVPEPEETACIGAAAALAAVIWLRRHRSTSV
jgi:subtilisin-like proprotein convertase family protein